jgi:undecaprenyl-diphosphatase
LELSVLHVAMSSSVGQLPVDRSWFLDVNAFSRATGWLHAPVTAFAQYGVVLFALLLIAGWWTARRSADAAAVSASLWAPVGTVLAVGLNQPVVNEVAEPRPYAILPHVLVLVSHSADYSYPSDHAVMAGAVAAGLLMANRRVGLLAVVAAALMAFARVYVGAHYPGDVIGGLVFGAVVTLLGHVVLRRVVVRVVHRLTDTPLGTLVRRPGVDLRINPLRG